jgi:hypothetical protein
MVVSKIDGGEGMGQCRSKDMKMNKSRDLIYTA